MDERAAMLENATPKLKGHARVRKSSVARWVAKFEGVANISTSDPSQDETEQNGGIDPEQKGGKGECSR